MFRAMEMRKVRVLVLDTYLDKVMRMFGRLGSVQITNVKEKDNEPAERKRLLEKYSDLVNRIRRLSETLNIKESDMESLPTPEKSSEEYLHEMEDTIGEIEKKTAHIPEKLDCLREEGALLENQKTALEALEKLAVKTKWLGSSAFLYNVAGFINIENIEALKARLDEATGGDFILVLQAEETSAEQELVVIAVLSQAQHEVDGILRTFRFETLDLAGKDLENVKKRLTSIGEESEKLRGTLEAVKKDHLEDILIAREIAGIEKNEEELSMNFGKTQRVYVIEGWVPTKDIEDVKAEVEKATEGNNIIQVSEPELEDDVPVEFNNPKPLKPFEIVMDMFGRPAYKEIDPTPLMAITFPIFFGLMFGDLGHGLILALAGLGMILAKRGNDSAWKFGMLLLYCGVAAVLFGALYGSFFGDEKILPRMYEDMGLPAILAPYGIGHYFTVAEGGSEEAAGGEATAEAGHGEAVADAAKEEAPEETQEEASAEASTAESSHGEEVERHWVPFRSPPNDMLEMIGMTMLFGAIHMALGLIISGLNKFRDEGKLALIMAAAKIWFLSGEIAVIAAIFKAFPIPFFAQLKDMFPLTDIVLVGLGIPMVIMLAIELIHLMHHFTIGGLFQTILQGWAFEVFETFSMFLSNTISYSRLLILAVVHAMMMTAIYRIAGMPALQSYVVIGPLIVLGGNVLVLVLEGLVVFIHTIRLHFYEWFTKFYTAGGIRYAPFLVKRRYTRLAD